ncbi:MAG TPA: Calx-beta domain-containing protein [Gemmataceae bacterium]|jgi:3-deoxy-D-arabino-heptulosonate 7-phosphate (DAHP) synthase|nr:Calx-beta domain-containing protein [Gemmataceae bacterium]
MSANKNSFRSLLLRPFRSRTATPPRRKGNTFGLRFDALEDRTVPAILALDAADQIVANSAGTDESPVVAMKPDGTGFVVAYDAPDANGFGVFFRRYDANWQPAGAAVAVNTFTTNDQRTPSIGIDAAGNFVIAYTSMNQFSGTSNRDIYARRFQANGTPIDGAEFLVNTTINNGTQFTPSVGVDPNSGKFAITWAEASNFLQDDIFLKGYSGITVGGSGTPTVAYGDMKVNNPAASPDDQGNPVVALDTAGNAVVVYDSFNQDVADNGFGVYYRRVTAAGALNGGEVLVNTGQTAGIQQRPSIGMDGAGNFVITWQSVNVDGSAAAVVMQRYNAAAAPQGVNTTVNTTTQGSQVTSHVARAAGGDYVVTWTGEEQDLDGNGSDIYYKKFDSAGTVLIPETIANAGGVTDDQTQDLSAPAINTAGDFVIAWQDQTGAGPGDIKMRRFAEAPVVQFAAASSSPSESVGNASYTVNRVAPGYVNANLSTAVSVTRTGGTATPGTDFTTTFPQTVTIAAGSSSQSANVAIVNDSVYEGNETINLGFAASANYTIGGTSAHAMTIVDDETPPSISIGNASLTEGDSGTTNMTFTVTLSGQSALTTTANFNTANGTAIAGTDYNAASGTVTFPALNTSQNVTVQVIGNTIFQANRQFTVNLSSPANGTIGTGTGTGTINDDDAPASIAVSSGNNQSAGVSTNFASPLVALVKNAAGNPVQGVSVVYAAPGAGASSVFSTTTNTITVTSNASGLASTGTFAANATAGANYTVSAAATGGSNPSTNFSLTNTAPPVINIGNGSLTEGDSGTANMTFTVTLTTTSSSTVTVNFATANGTAIAGTDYTSTSGVVTFAPGQSSQPVVVPIIGNTIFQANRQFTVALSGPSGAGATIGTGTGTGTINDDDAPASIAISSGNNQSTGTGTNFTSPLITLVKNANNNAVQGVSVTYTAPAAGASSVFSTTTNTITVTSNASGLASTGTFAANNFAGANYTVSAAAAGGSNPSTNFTLTNIFANAIATASFSADTGISSTDFITKTAAQTISGTTTANLASGEFVEVSLDNGTTWTTATSSVGSNTWTINVTLVASNTLKVRVSNGSSSGPVFSQAYVLDTTAPTVTNVTATNANGSYKAGAAILTTIALTESVTVNTGGGTPTLALNSGGAANYSSGTGGSTLTFTYNVLAGENSPDLDYTSTSALTTGGGLITDTAGNNAVLTLATPNTAGSLGANKNILIDTAGPTASITGTPANPTNSTSATFTFTGSDPTVGGASSGVNHLETKVDGGSFATAASPQTFSGLSEGSHTFQVRAVDNAGNIGAPSSFTWVVDTTAPTAAITGTPADPTNSTSATFTFTGSDPTSGGVSSGVNHLETKLDGGSFATVASPQALSGLSEGSHTFSVRAVDNAGNTGAPTSFTWVVDTTGPTTSIIGTPANPTNSTSATFTFSGIDPVSGGVSTGVNHLETSIDGGAFATATSPQTFSSLAEGLHTFQVRAVDNAGNTGSATSFGWTVDTTGPTTTITGTPANPTNSTSATFTFTGSDPTSGGVSSGVNHLETQIDGGGFATVASPQTFNGLAEGSHTFQVRAVDNAGNVGSPSSYTWTVDTTGPTASITGTPANPTNSTSATFTFTGSDPTSGGVNSGVNHLETKLDGGAFTTATSPQIFNGLTEGNHTFQVRAVDNAGNVGNAATFNWVVDVTNPTAAITGMPANPTNSTSATFAFTSTDPFSGGVSSGVNHVETSLDGGAFATATSPQTFNGLAEGSHTFQVRAVDNAGNTSAPASFTWVIDTTGPTTTITGTPANPTNSTSATFTFTGNDPTSGGVNSGVNRLETKLDGGAFTTATSPQTFNGLAEGNHTFQVRAVDNAGNVGTPSSFTWMVDVTNPSATITGMPANPSNVATPTFTFTGSDPTSGGVSSGVNHLETQIDGSPFAPATSPQTLSPLPDGSHTFQVRAVDNAGNVGAAASYTWVIDTQAPTIASVTSTTANGVYGVGSAINVKVSFSEPVTLAGGNLTVNLDSGGTVTITPFTNQTSVSGTYTVAAGENSADLNSTSLTLAGGATLRDAATNNATLTIPSGQSLADSSAIIVDTLAPTIGISGPSRAFANSANPVTYTITYTDVNLTAVTLTNNDVVLNTTNGANANVTVSPTASLDTWTVQLSNISGNGLIGISIKKDTATDAAGNKAGPAGPSATFEADNIIPVVTIATPSVTTTKAGPVSFGVSVSDINLITPATLTAGQVQVVGTPATVTGDVAVSQVDPTHFTVTVSNVRGGQGSFFIRLPAGFAADKAGNVNAGPVDSATVQVTGIRKIRLAIVPPPAVLKPGQNYAYVIAYSNRGTQRADNVSIVVTLPEGATFNSALSTAGWTAIGNGQYKLGLGNLAIGAHGRVKFAVTLPATPPASDTAAFSASITDDLALGKPLATRTVSSRYNRSRYK